MSKEPMTEQEAESTDWLLRRNRLARQWRPKTSGTFLGLSMLTSGETFQVEIDAN